MKSQQFLPLLFQPEELTASLHSFKNKVFKKARVCGVCKQILDGQGISCRGESSFSFRWPSRPKHSEQPAKHKAKTAWGFPEVRCWKSPSEPDPTGRRALPQVCAPAGVCWEVFPEGRSRRVGEGRAVCSLSGRVLATWVIHFHFLVSCQSLQTFRSESPFAALSPPHWPRLHSCPKPATSSRWSLRRAVFPCLPTKSASWTCENDISRFP